MLKSKILLSILGMVALHLVGFSQSMRFVGVRTNLVSNMQEFIQWDTISLPNCLTDSANINGVVTGSSTFNSNNGNFYISTFQNNQPATLSYNVNRRSSITLNTPLNFGVGTKVDQSTGKLYTIQQARGADRPYITSTDPISGVTALVDSLPNTVSGYFSDGMVFNSNNQHLYFHYLDTNNVPSLMEVDVTSNPVNINSVALSSPSGSRLGNLVLEFDLNSNLLHCFSMSLDPITGNSVLYFGVLNPTAGNILFQDSILGYKGILLSSGTFDQTGQNFCLQVMDSAFRVKMVGYNVRSSTWFEAPLPAGNVYEVEANNFAYIQAKYALATRTLNKGIAVYPNPAQDFVVFTGARIGSTYRVINQNGQAVLSGKVLQSEERLDVTQLNAGLYLLMMEETGKVSKFIINR